MGNNSGQVDSRWVWTLVESLFEGIKGMNLANIPFRLESQLARAWFSTTGLRPSSRPFVSGDSFRSLADHRVEPGSHFIPSAVKQGEVVFVQVSEIESFATRMLPMVRKPFVLITHNGDLTIGDSFSDIASEGKIIHWFAQNAVLKHPKVTAIPIGLENRSLHCNGVVRDFKRLAKGRGSKNMRILYAFSIETNQLERRAALAALQASRLAQNIQRVNSRTYRKRLVRYAFVASPPGNGVDCHRTWEALYLGVIPVVRRSPFYGFFPNLPVLDLEDWNEIAAWDEQFLLHQYERLSSQIDSVPYLQFDYWENRISIARAQTSNP
jgi:hypothetical protein